MRSCTVSHRRCSAWLPLPLAPLLAFAFACHEPPDDSDGPPVGDTDPDTDVDDTDTGSPGALLQALEVEVSPYVPTVARVRWTTREEAVGGVRFGVPGELALAAPETQGVEHEAYLLGLLPDTDYAFQVTVTAGEQSEQSAEQAFHTGTFAAEVPTVALELLDPAASAPGYTIVPLESSGECYTMVLDQQGRTVWAQPINCLTHRTYLAPDGSGFVSHSRTAPQNPVILRQVSFFGESIRDLPVEDSHHDFTIVDDTTYALLGYTERSFSFDGGEPIRLVGDTIIEVDLDGNERVVWDLFDHLEPQEDQLGHLSDWSSGAYDWSHCNYISYIPEEDAYYLSSRALDALFKVDRSSGELIWALSDVLGDFTTEGDPLLVHRPHSIEPVEGGLLYFNQKDPGAGDCSEAVRAILDPGAGTATRAWSYQTDNCLGVDYMGSAWPLDNGNVLAVFSQRGQMDEVASDGTVVQRLVTGIGWWFSYAMRVESLYGDAGR
jgi:hypothetical protein